MKKAVKLLLVSLVALSQLAYPIKTYATVIDEVNNENTLEENNIQNENIDNQEQIKLENNVDDQKQEDDINNENKNNEVSNLSKSFKTLNEENNSSYVFDIKYDDSIDYLEAEKININIINNDENSSIVDENKYIIKATLTFNQLLDNNITNTQNEEQILLLEGIDLKNYNLTYDNIGKGLNGEYKFDIKMYEVGEDLINEDQESLKTYIENKGTIYNKSEDFKENKIATKLVLHASNLNCTDKECTIDKDASDKNITFTPEIVVGDTSEENLGLYYSYKINGITIDEKNIDETNLNSTYDFSTLLYGKYSVTVSIIDKNQKEVLSDTLNITYGNSEENNLEEYFTIDDDTTTEELLSMLISSTVVENINDYIDVDILKELVDKLPIDELVSRNLTDALGEEVIATSFLELENNYYSVVTAESFIGRIIENDTLPKVADIINAFNNTNLTVSVVDSNNNIVDSNKYIETPMKLVVTTNSKTLTYNFVVMGDLDGSLVSDTEVNTMINTALGINSLNTLERNIVDYNMDGIIDIYDISYFAGSIGMGNWVDNSNVVINDTLSTLLTINKTNIRVNDTFTVTLSLKGFKENYINGIEGILNYDKTALDLVGFTTNESLNQYGGYNYSASKFIQAGKEIVDADSEIITFTFKALKETNTSIKINDFKASQDGMEVNTINNSSVNIKIDRALSNNNDIIELTPSTGKLDKEFNKNIYEYNLYVDYRVNSITLEGLLGDKYASTMGFKEYKLTGDITVIVLEVVSESGEVKTYKINVIKEYPKTTNTTTNIVSLSSNNYLKTLEIKGYEIKFDKNTLEYEITVDSDVTSLDITAISELTSANVRIYGNDNFKEGENIVTVVVTAEDGSEKTYTIKVNKKAKDEVTEDDDNADENNNTEKTIIIILIILVVIGLLYLIFKKDDDNKNEKK